MLTEVEVRTDQGALLSLPLQDVSEGLAISNIDGLDPVKATIVSSSFAQLDGAQYQSSRRETRNLLMTMLLEPDYAVGTARDLRNKLYSFFMTEKRVSLRFVHAGGLSVDIVGVVESFDSALFSASPEVTVSVLCFDPDFFDPDVVAVAGSTVETSVETTIDYEGSVETGITFTMTLDRDVDEFTIYHTPEDGVVRTLQFSSPLVSGSVLTIVTSPGDKSATVIDGTGERSVLYGISPYSNWINLFPGDNQVRVYAEGAAVPYTIEYTTKYGGL